MNVIVTVNDPLSVVLVSLGEPAWYSALKVKQRLQRESTQQAADAAVDRQESAAVEDRAMI